MLSVLESYEDVIVFEKVLGAQPSDSISPSKRRCDEVETARGKPQANSILLIFTDLIE